MTILTLALYFGVAREKGQPIDPNGGVVLVVDHGLHAGLVFERAELSTHPAPNIQALLLQFPQAEWFEFGWGDEGFYQSAATFSDVSFAMASRALLWPTDSVVHVATGFGNPAAIFSPLNPVSLQLSELAMRQMLDTIGNSFASMVPTGSGLYAISRFYNGVGQYHLFMTCNNWVSIVLRDAGIAASPLMATFSAGLLFELRVRYGVI
ncbi:MAG: DUF2459 domain-containing protein [Rhodobacteraceae bacterium]|nr:DUF2459 domain-containing protein [Paracoccaceae bacterium]